MFRSGPDMPKRDERFHPLPSTIQCDCLLVATRGIDIEGSIAMLSVLSSEAETVSWETAFIEG